MAVAVPSTRRDKRFQIPVGAGIVEIPPTTARKDAIQAALTKLSVAGVAFEINRPELDLAPGSRLPHVRIRVGDCVLTGELAVRDARPMGDSRVEVGGVFVPSSPEVESRLMALLAGFAAALTD